MAEKHDTVRGLVLAGVALSSLFSGGSTLLQYFADDTQLGAVVFWTFGDLGSTNWSELAMLLAVDVAALIYFLLKRWDYNAIHSGSDTAASLGVNVKAVTLVSMTVCTVASALAVSFVGIISFIGLVAPHAMRRFVGDDYRWLLPCSAAGGALLLILADHDTAGGRDNQLPRRAGVPLSAAEGRLPQCLRRATCALATHPREKYWTASASSANPATS